jgi:hypothetical protein
MAEEISSSVESALINDITMSSINEKSVGQTTELASKAMKKVESFVLYSFHEIPLWQQDNQYILRGYRRELSSFKRCIFSVLHLHNETGKLNEVGS